MREQMQTVYSKAIYLLMLLKGSDLGAGLAFGEASPGAFGAVACPGWFDGVDPFTLEPLALALGDCAFGVCYMHAQHDELSTCTRLRIASYLGTPG